MRSPSEATPPEGFILVHDAISPDHVAAYISSIGMLPFSVVRMRGRTLRRRVASFGVGFGTNFQRLAAAPELPPTLRSLRACAAQVFGLQAQEFNQALVQIYPPGATIGWHRDAAAFGPSIIGVSFGGPAILRFRHPARPATVAIGIPAASIYLVRGTSRTEWEHSIAPVREERLSVTFRSFDVASQVDETAANRTTC
jgi:alkylated DNA repair dioxygenase AlkB